MNFCKLNYILLTQSLILQGHPYIFFNPLSDNSPLISWFLLTVDTHTIKIPHFPKKKSLGCGATRATQFWKVSSVVNITKSKNVRNYWNSPMYKFFLKVGTNSLWKFLQPLYLATQIHQPLPWILIMIIGISITNLKLNVNITSYEVLFLKNILICK